jgi:hypothetical protein
MKVEWLPDVPNIRSARHRRKSSRRTIKPVSLPDRHATTLGGNVGVVDIDTPQQDRRREAGD